MKNHETLQKFNYSGIDVYTLSLRDALGKDHTKVTKKLNDKKQVMVVDDDEDIAEAIKLILEYAGYDVLSDSGTKVEEKLKKDNPNLILLDILLEGRDGRDICRNIKRAPETKNIPVILISAHADASKSILECNADGFIAKPFDMDEMLKKIKKVIH